MECEQKEMQLLETNKMNIYIDIDSKNEISFISSNKQNFMESIFKELIESNKDLIGSEINKFFEKIIPNTGNENSDLFSINLSLLKNYYKNNELTKKKIESSINYFEKRAQEFSEVFALTEENVENLGKIILYSFKKMGSFKVKNFTKLKEIMNTTSFMNLNVIDDYENYKKNNSNSHNLMDKTVFWKENRKKYQLPGTFTFMLNFFSKITKAEFNINCLAKDLFPCFISVVANFGLIFKQLNEVSLSLSNIEYLIGIYERYQERVNNEEKRLGKFVKKYTYRSDYSSLSEDWNFQNDYLIVSPNPNQFSEGYEDYENQGNESRDSLISTTSKVKEEEKKQSQFQKKVIENIHCFEFIVILFSFLSRTKNIKVLTLHFYDSYLRENKTMLKNVFRLNTVDNFHFLDFLLPRTKTQNENVGMFSVKELNLEFNSLDLFSFEKIMAIIKSSVQLRFLRIALFTPDCTYLPAGLKKLVTGVGFKTNLSPNQKNSSFNEQTSAQNSDLEYMIISQLLETYERNIQLFFYLIQQKESIRELSLFADIPTVISLNEKYMLVLTKFIINILIMLNRKHCFLEKVKFLFPMLIFDSRRFPGIIDVLEDINYSKTNSNLKKMYLQFQIYQVPNLHNLMTKNLIHLTIADLDQASFDSFISFFSSSSFTRESKLEIITIGLLSMVTNLSSIRKAVKKFFSVHLMGLNVINFYTHLELTERDYQNIIDYIKFNWVKKYYIQFSINASEVISKHEKNNKNEIFCFKDKSNSFNSAKAIEKCMKSKFKHKSILDRVNMFCFESNKVELNVQFT